MKIKENHTPSGVRFLTLEPWTAKEAPLLLSFSDCGSTALEFDPYRRTGEVLHACGWNVISLDLPCHGEDVRKSEPDGIEGWAHRIKNGEDVIAEFQRKMKDVVDHLISTKQADPARIAAAGTSRGAYIALQIAAAIPQVRAVALFSPAVDLMIRSAFQEIETHPTVQKMALTNIMEALSNRSLWICTGNNDPKVGTDRILKFVSQMD